jgi:opacity protein-like surface antigen
MRFSRLVGIAALASAPALLQAQSAPSTRPFGLGVSAGASVPVGTLRDNVNTGYSIAGHVYVMPPSLTMLSFRGDVSYDRWSFKNSGAVAGITGNASVLGVTANAILKMSSTGMFHPYLIGGGGLYSGKSSVSAQGVSVDSPRSNKFGLQGGAGLDFALSGFSTFLEAKFVNVFQGSSDNGNGTSTSNGSTRYIPITFGVRF